MMRQSANVDTHRTKRLIEQSVVLCQTLLRRMGMAASGWRNRLGALHGPQNEANKNGSHPAQHAALQCTSDVQLLHRMPIAESTHAEAAVCNERCWEMVNTASMVEAAQGAHDAQAGYACDYSNKRSARSCNDMRECANGA